MSRSLHCIAGLALVLAVSGCVDYLDPGESGEFRYFSEVRGAPPLSLLPPVTDRSGNAYVLFGASDLSEVEVFVGHRTGGWSSGCQLKKGDDRGVHGWVGRATDRAWYWAGDALVEVSGKTGSCTLVLDRDPASNADLQFQAVIPIVKETPSRTFTVGLIQSPSDRVPFFVVIDLDLGRYTSVVVFEPSDAENIQVLGVGADAESDVGFVVVRYERSGSVIVEGLTVDLDGNIIGRASIPGADSIPEDGIAGFIQATDGQVAVALVRDTGQLLVFNRANGGLRDVPGIDAVGVHRFEGALWVAGGLNGQAGLVPLTVTGEPATSPVVWAAAERFQASLSGNVGVLDDRSDPRRRVTWTTPSSAIGLRPFLSEHSPDVYALGTTGWLIAGPSFDVGGVARTSVAFGPVGISYP